MSGIVLRDATPEIHAGRGTDDADQEHGHDPCLASQPPARVAAHGGSDECGNLVHRLGFRRHIRWCTPINEKRRTLQVRRREPFRVFSAGAAHQSRCYQCAEWLARPAVDEKFEVQMGAGRTAGVTNEADRLASANALPGAERWRER